MVLETALELMLVKMWTCLKQESLIGDFASGVFALDLKQPVYSETK